MPILINYPIRNHEITCKDDRFSENNLVTTVKKFNLYLSLFAFFFLHQVREYIHSSAVYRSDRDANRVQVRHRILYVQTNAFRKS